MKHVKMSTLKRIIREELREQKSKVSRDMTPSEIQSTFKLLDDFWYEQLDDPSVKVDWQPRIVRGSIIITYDDGSDAAVISMKDAQAFKKNQLMRHDTIKLEQREDKMSVESVQNSLDAFLSPLGYSFDDADYIKPGVSKSTNEYYFEEEEKMRIEEKVKDLIKEIL